MSSLDRVRLLDDLKGVVKGEILGDELSCVLYSTDASLFEVAPAGVVAPRDEEDLCALVRFAAENQVPLVPRGAGTGTAGACLGSGLVVDFSRHFREILAVGTDTVRVEAGAVLRDIQRTLATVGRRIAPDPATEDCTVGGMIASNASGPRALRHGTMRDHIESIRAVLDTGDAVTVGQVPRWPNVDTSHGRLEDIVTATVTLLEQNAGLIRACRPAVPLDRCGYALNDVLSSSKLDLVRLFAGSEGTLALFTEAVLRTVPLPAGRSLVLLGFARIDAALRAARLAVPTGVSACDLLDRRLLRLSRGDPQVADLVPEGAEAVLLVEYEADSPAEADRLAHDLAEPPDPRGAPAHLRPPQP